MTTRRRALVTGGSGGIGAAICYALARDDLHVFVHANSNKAKAETVAEQIRADGGQADVIVCDVTDADACQHVLLPLAEQAPFDVIVSNAGIAKDATMTGMTPAIWREVLAVSLDGFFNVTQPVLMPLIKKRSGGRIIAITSVLGITGRRGQANYAAAKSGIHGAVKSLAQELATRKITVNAVAPGIIDTGMAVGKFDQQHIKATVSMQRAGTAAEVAAVVAFLASDAASYVTGQVIGVNGGMA